MQPRDYREYSAEGALIAGGGAAILLQLGDPVVAAGVAAHSDFSSDPMRRLRHTLAYVYAIGLGDPHQAAGAARTVNRAHAPVPGAFDPDHQLWVAATLYAVGDAYAHPAVRTDAAAARRRGLCTQRAARHRPATAAGAVAGRPGRVRRGTGRTQWRASRSRTRRATSPTGC